jgi:hypothetical protein
MTGLARPAFLLVVLTAGCNSTLPTLCDGGTCPTQRIVSNVFQGTLNRELDVLFVIDDTPAIAPHAARVSVGLVEMATVLRNLVPTPSLHVGAVAASSCPPSPMPFLRWE